ncbi:MAG TPA: HAMP domain-containing sensor histidine kinase [Gemmatimonadaceae bacterium]|nr:HAMP domain-containing sensor histidine kinase [Gemmatimonadaceae bacterium]
MSITALVRGIQAAAARAADGIAASAKRAPEEVQRQLGPAVRWLVTRVESCGGGPAEAPPIIAREYVDRLRAQLVRELSTCEPLDGREVVQLMSLLEQLSEAWKQTDRGRFMAYLTGSESASAVVAIAHDIRSPLSSILILLESLRRGRFASRDPITERQLGLIYGATQGLATLASDLIDAARGDEQFEGDARPFSIVEMMHSVGSIVEPIAEEKGLQLRVEHTATDARIGHASPLHRVLLNLTSNALRYTESGSVALGCRDLSATGVEFWVQDTGGGLPAEVRRTLFDAFRPEQIALRFSSAGLGLSTVRALLSSMRSSLRVETSASGTRLSFELELQRSPR